MPLVSVIIPAYNAAGFLETCIASVVDQSLEDFEIVVVDDGSADGTSQIVQELGRSDDRVRLVRHAENRGLHHARMTGALEAKGVYSLYLDADDELVDSRVLERLMAKATDEEADIVRFGLKAVACNGTSDSSLSSFELWANAPTGSCTAKEMARLVFASDGGYVTSWNMDHRLFRTSVLADAFAHMSTERLERAEDGYEYFVVLSVAANECDAHEIIGYRYNMGLGVTNDRSLSAQQFECEVCMMLACSDAAERYAASLEDETWAQYAAAFRQRLVLHATDMWYRRVNVAERREALELFARVAGGPEVSREVKWIAWTRRCELSESGIELMPDDEAFVLEAMARSIELLPAHDSTVCFTNGALVSSSQAEIQGGGSMAQSAQGATFKTLEPIYTVDETRSDEPVVVVFAANDYYAPYLTALIASILDHCSSDRRYDLIVLSEDFSEHHRHVLSELAGSPNASIRFLDVNDAMKPYQSQLRTWGHFKIETYFRLLLPQLLPSYHKALYLDADMICLHDVAELFDMDVEGQLIAACKDADTAGIYNGIDIDVGQPDKKNYMDNVLCIDNPYDYFQAGTILFNLDEWRRSIDVEEVIAFARKDEWQLLDQDVLNYVCQGRVAFADMAWNVMFDLGGFRIREIISHAPAELYEAYLAARNEPKIVHYAGHIKPWNNVDCDFAECFWKYARTAPLYEVCLQRLFEETINRMTEPTKQDVQRARTIAEEALAEAEGALSIAGQALDCAEAAHKKLERMPSTRAKNAIYQGAITPLAQFVRRRDEKLYDSLRSIYRKIIPR